MAVILHKTLEEQTRSAAFLWETLTTADTASPVKVQNMQGLAGAVQVTGTFGSATVVLQVSNDGTNYVTLSDSTGAAISLTAAGMREFSTAARFLRPSVSGGTGDDLDVIVVLRG